METLNQFKEEIKRKVEFERTKMNEKYDRNIEEMEKKTNIPEIINYLVEIFGNSLSQQHLMKDMLASFLEASFFKEALDESNFDGVVHGANYLIFQKGYYSVEFATSKAKIIKIVRHVSPVHFYPEYLGIEEEYLNFNILWDNYKKGNVNFSELKKSYLSLLKKNKYGFVESLFKNIEKEIEEYALDLKEKIQKSELRQIKFNEKFEKYKAEELEFLNLMADLKKDLNEFQENGWLLIFEGLGTLTPK